MWMLLFGWCLMEVDMPVGVVEGSAEWRGRTIAAFVRQHDEMKSRIRELEEALSNRERLFSCLELADYITSKTDVEVGYYDVLDFAADNELWFTSKGAITDIGRWHVVLTANGFLFTEAGRVAVLEEFGVKP